MKIGFAVVVAVVTLAVFFAVAGREYYIIKRLEYPINSSIINYYVDNRTGLCFATIGVVSKSTRFHDVWSESFTNVPCSEKVLSLVQNRTGD